MKFSFKPKSSRTSSACRYATLGTVIVLYSGSPTIVPRVHSVGKLRAFAGSGHAAHKSTVEHF